MMSNARNLFFNKNFFMRLSIFILAVSIFFFQCEKETTEPELDKTVVKSTITFKSVDDLTITADTYIAEANSEFILLCHQAGYSRGEYKDIALEFGKNGYNCIAIDQRSGNEVNGVVNETAMAAQTAGLGTGFLDAEPDIIAAIDKAYELNGNQPIFVLGSSYSSSWALLLGKANTKVKGVAAFSPRENLSGRNITNELSGYAKPVFVTSAKDETLTVENLVVNISATYLTHFKSQEAGIHGARCLWDSTEGAAAYWIATLDFFNTNK